MRLRTALNMGFLGLAAWGCLRAEALWKDHSALDYENFPAPTDWSQITESPPARLRYPDIYSYPLDVLGLRDGKPFRGYWMMDGALQ